MGDNGAIGDQTMIVSNDRADLLKKPVLLALQGDGVDGEEHQFAVIFPLWSFRHASWRRWSSDAKDLRPHQAMMQ